jgi:hypothetical protein
LSTWKTLALEHDNTIREYAKGMVFMSTGELKRLKHYINRRQNRVTTKTTLLERDVVLGEDP